jgi:UDP:flavonoid glycosyltransferase YjiC (YdhE family)
VLGISEQEMESWRPAGRKGYRAETRLRYSGPLYARLGGDLPPEVDAFLEGPESCIYVAINSTTAEFVRAVVRRLRELGVKLLVVSTVHDLDDLVDERVMIRPILPSHRVMPRVRLAVTAGGQGSVQTAMAAGVPVLGFPIQPEQDLNLVLVERLGAARRVALRKARSPAIAALARELIDDPSYRDAARRIQADYARIDGPARAVDAIAELLARGSD